MEQLKSNRTASQLPVNQPDAWTLLHDGEKAILARWITEHISPSPHVSSKTSYDLKLAFGSSVGGFYLTNGQFKGAMQAAGYEAVDESMVKWAYRITVNP